MASTNQPSMQGLLLAPLVRLNSLSESLLRSTASTSSSHSTLLKPLLAEYLDCDSQITAALDEARIHQAKQREIHNLTTETLGLNAHLREIITALVQGRNKLQNLIEEGDAVLQASTEASNNPTSHKEILIYASKLATFTSAPPAMEPLKPESTFDGPLNPPFPTVEMMRKGKLNNEPPLGLLGETREVGRPLSPSFLQTQAESLSQLVHSAPTQYSTYAARQHPSGTNPDDLFELDLNPDF